MTNAHKTMLAIPFFGIWGYYLLYIWLIPGAVPDDPGMLRKVLFLSRSDLQPTWFTLGFGILFLVLAAVATWRVANERYLGEA